MTSDDPIVTIADMTRLYCLPGVQRAFVRAGKDIEAFITEGGARASTLRGLGFDAMLDRVLKTKSEAQSDG